MHRLSKACRYACDGPGPALDISEDLIRLFCESNKLDFQKLRTQYSPLRLKEIAGGFRLDYLADEGFPEGYFNVTWAQRAEIIRDVEATGTQHVLKRPAVPYLRKDGGPLPWLHENWPVSPEQHGTASDANKPPS